MSKRKKAAAAPQAILRHAKRPGQGYGAARQPRGRDPWQPPSGTAQRVVGPSWATIADRARDAVRNDPYAARIVEVWTGNIVATGATTRWANPAVAAAWDRWAGGAECDAGGMLQWGALQAVAVRSVIESGEVLAVYETVPVTADNPVGLAVRLLEGDHLDDRIDGQLPNGNVAVQGIEFSPQGRRVAYHLLPTMPNGELFPTAMPSIRVDASRVRHVFRQRRPGQVRDVSWLAPILWRLRDLGDYENALLRKAQIEACLALIVSGDDEGSIGPSVPQDGRVPADQLTDGMGNPVEQLEPGTILYRRNAGSTETVNPTSSTSHTTFARRNLEAAAVGVGLTYDQVSGDLTGANYSSLRAGKIEFRRVLEQIQYGLLIGQLVAPVAQTFYTRGATRGLWPDRGERAEHTPATPEMIDPMKDTMALIAQVRAGFVSQKEAVAGFGYDFATVLQQIREANQALTSMGIILDTDPRHTARSGGAQDAAQNAAAILRASEDE